jgi:hypothetical protein
MNRGVIQITKSELQEVLNSFSNTQQNSPLFSRLNVAAIQPDEQLSIQLSENEVETLLDNLGISENDEDPSKASARGKISEFLKTLRS